MSCCPASGRVCTPPSPPRWRRGPTSPAATRQPSRPRSRTTGCAPATTRARWPPGTEAERVGALAEAADHDKRALALWGRVPDAERLAGIDRAALLARAADAAAWTGDAAGAIELVDAAIALRETAAEPERVAALLQQRAGFLCPLGRAPESVPGLERAVALIPADPPTAERAEALGRLGVMVMLLFFFFFFFYIYFYLSLHLHLLFL